MANGENEIMGTNYDWHEEICESCGHTKKQTHIGKASGGWTFSFHGTDEIRSFKDWQYIFQNEKGEIRNEYGETITVDDFCRLVKDLKKEKRNHAKEFKGHYGEHWLDPEGHSFSGGEFS